MEKLNGQELTKLDLEIIREDCSKYLDQNNGLDPDPEGSDAYNWVECIIGGGSWVVDCHMHSNKINDPDDEDTIVIRIFDTYIDDDEDHRVTDTGSDCVAIYL
jgi:hypothetical protein